MVLFVVNKCLEACRARVRATVNRSRQVHWLTGSVGKSAKQVLLYSMIKLGPCLRVSNRGHEMVPGGLAVVLSICLSLMASVSAESQQCVENNNDASYTASDMEGTWYPVEIILHRNDSKIYGVPLDTSCPEVTFSVSPRNKKVMTMLWNATQGDLEYKFQQKGRGQWQAMYDQRGSLVKNDYRHFGGVFSVFQLEADSMFLSFCSKSFRVLNTVAFSKNLTIPESVTENVMRKLENKKIKRTRQITVQNCEGEDEEKGYGHRILSSCLLSILPSLVVRFCL